MLFFRCIKPDWAKPNRSNGEVNPDFVEEIEGDETVEGCLSEEYVNELNAKGYNIYWLPNHPSTDLYSTGVKYLNGRQIDVFDYVFIDMDLKDGYYPTIDAFLDVVRKFPVTPSMTIKSGNGAHVYWRVKDVERMDYVIAQFALLTHFNTDPSIWTVLQLMRFPGSKNTKAHNNFKQTEFVEDLCSDSIYSLTDFPPEIFDSIPPKLLQKAQLHCDKLDGKINLNLPDEINVDELPDRFIELLMNNKTVRDLFHDPRGTAFGDRSKADMSLCNFLFKEKFNRKEAINIMANTQKATSKGASRMDYAATTVDKTYSTRVKNKFLSVGEYLAQGGRTQAGEYINGPSHFDCLEYRWEKKQCLGLIAGPGTGKTATTLEMFDETIENNPENDDIFVFFSLEMPAAQVVGRWVKLVGRHSEKANRLYVIGNEDPETGDPRNIGLQEIYEYCQELMQMTGKKIRMIALDHIGLISRRIDMRKKHTFGAQDDQFSGHGQIKTVSLNTIAMQMKPLAKMLDCFNIVLTQTTKEKGKGDLPIDKDGARGISDYEHIMDFIITLWQPLMRVQSLTPNYFTAWQYVKVREKGDTDGVKTYEQKLLTYEMNTGRLRTPTPEEYMNFKEILPKANDARKAAEEKKGNGSDGYTLSVKVDTSRLRSGLLSLVKPKAQ